MGAMLAAIAIAAPVASATPGGPLRGYGWSETNPDAPWAARAGLQVAGLGDRIFLMGGRTPLDPQVVPIPGASTLWNDVWRTDDQGASWAEVGDAPWAARAYFQAVTRGGAMFVLGGQDFRVIDNPACQAFPPGACPPQIPPQVPSSTFFNDVWRSRDGASWTRMTADAGWEGRAGLSANVLGGQLYVFGGSRNDDSAIVGPGGPARIYYNDVWRSRDGRSWEQVTEHAPWAPRAGAATVVKNGWLYLLGGEDGFVCNPAVNPRCPPYFNDVWRTRDGEHWEQVTASAGWSPRPGHQCAVVLEQIVCFGGFGLPVNPNDVSASRDGRNWTTLAGPPWNAFDPTQVKYDFDVLAVSGTRGAPGPAILTFGGDRETFDFGDPLNYTRVDDDVWRFGRPARGR
jgi:hypothetical protein